MNKPPKKEVTFVDTKVHTLILRSRSGSYVNVRSLIFIIQDEEQVLILLLKFGQITIQVSGIRDYNILVLD